MASAVKTISFTVSGSVSTYPDWINTAISNGWAVGTWARLSGSTASHGLTTTNTLRSVKTFSPGTVGDVSTSGINGIMWNWCGGWACRSLGTYGTLGVGIGGGHSGYDFDDVFGWDVATRTWAQLHAAQTTAYNTTFGEYADGAPGAIHSYFQNVAFPAIAGYPKGGLIVPLTAITPGTSDAEANNRIAYPHVLNFNDGTWARMDQLPNAATRTGWFGAVSGIWDKTRSRHLFWSARSEQTNNHFSALDPTAAPGSQWTDYTPSIGSGGPFWNLGGIEQCLVIDPVRDIMISLDWRQTKTIRYVKLATPTAAFANTNTTWSITETGTSPSRAEGIGIDWSETLNAAYCWRGDSANVYRLAYASGSLGSPGVAGNLTYAWSNVLSGSNTITPTLQNFNSQKIYNRFRIFDYGDVVIATTVTNADGPVWGFRLK
jgi:hypothetical protein